MGRNIKRARQAQDLTQRELAVALETNEMQVSRWERGEHRPNALSEAKLATRLFEGDVSRLYEEPEQVVA